MQESHNHETSETSDKQANSINHLSDNYLGATNHLILKESIDTAVTFLYLPRPPDNENVFQRYLQCLTVLTQHLRPTILVHGVSAVTTTNL